mgnify:CR=1 FL=1
MKRFFFVVLGFFVIGGVLSQELVLNYSVEKQVIDVHPKLKELQGIDLGEEKFTEFSTLKLFDEFSIWERDSFKVNYDKITDVNTAVEELKKNPDKLKKHQQDIINFSNDIVTVLSILYEKKK